MSHTIVSFREIADCKIGTNLYQYLGMYFRLFATGVTPNGCWLTGPFMKQLVDIDANTGNDVYGLFKLEIEGMSGTVEASREYVKY